MPSTVSSMPTIDANLVAARKFVDFVLRGKGRDALLRAGYLVR